MEEVRIERLKSSDEKALLDEAFTVYPLIGALTEKPKARIKVMKAFLAFFAGKESLTYGIKKDDTMICGSVSVDSEREHSMFSLIRFIMSLSLALGWKGPKILKLFTEKSLNMKSHTLNL